MRFRPIPLALLVAFAFGIGYVSGWEDADAGWTTSTIAPPYPDSVRKSR